VPLGVLNRSRDPDRPLPAISAEDYRYLYETFQFDFEILDYDPDLIITGTREKYPIQELRSS
jgi:ABC-type enterochelin transport system substrate-binding protein